MSRVIQLALLMTLGCARYPDWEYVRIEPTVPASECVPRVQESCPPTALEGCENWYKKRATTYQANTVVRTGHNLAEYFACPCPFQGGIASSSSSQPCKPPPNAGPPPTEN